MIKNVKAMIQVDALDKLFFKFIELRLRDRIYLNKAC